jgi:penicillin-binding protein 1A
MEKGITPNDLVDDSPVTIGTWSPHNYSHKYRGKIPIYKALMVSSNVCAARIIKEVGVRPVIQLARVLGLTTPLEYDYTISLGSNGVKLFEFVRAYGAFANGGYIVQPYAIERIEDSRGRVLYRAPKAKSTHQLSLKTAAEMTAMMKTVILSGTGTAANIGKPAAGKTGTTDEYKDAYFVGYTPEIVTGVWVGDDNNKKMGGLTGGTVPARIWKDIMVVATKDSTVRDFDYPQVDLENYHASYDSVRVIGDDENPANEGGSKTNSDTHLSTDVSVENVQQETAQKETVQEAPKAVKPQSVPALKPVEKTTTTTKSAPIPMAVPESLR